MKVWTIKIIDQTEYYSVQSDLDLHCLQKLLVSLSVGKRVNSLPNVEILDWSKMKAFADYQIDVVKMMILSLIGQKTLQEKEENAGYQSRLP